VRRRDFTAGLLLAGAARPVRAQERANQHRIAIVISAGSAASIDDPASRAWQAFWDELRRLGDIEGKNLTVERYSGEGRPEGYGDLAREVVSRNPDLIVAISPPIAQAIGAATGKIPIVASGGYAGLPSLAHPGGNITGIGVDVGFEIYGKRLQILKEAVPSASKVAVLDIRTTWDSADGQQRREGLEKASRLLEISLTEPLLEEATPSEYQRVFAQIARDRSGAIIVMGSGELFAYRQLIVELAEKNRLPAISMLGALMSRRAD